MIRKTLTATQLATYSIDLPNAVMHGKPAPTGTGFFISPDGWFVTAAHVVTENGESDGPIRKDIAQAWLVSERPYGGFSGGMCQWPELDYVDPATDFALLKVDFGRNGDKTHLKDRTCFPYLEVSTRELEEGEPVYSFGYPLPDAGLLLERPGAVVGYSSYCPRVTSAIISSTTETTRFISSPADPKVYVLDKALNYGNSGGPIVATETGKVHALCSRFQPVFIPQPHLRDEEEKSLRIKMPSLYGIVSSLQNPAILRQLRSRNIPLSEV